MDVAARSFLTRGGLGEEARSQPHHCGEVFDSHLGERGVIGGAQRRTGSEIQLEKAGSRFGVHRGEFDTQGIEGRREGAYEGIETAQLTKAVAETAGERLAIRIEEAP